MPETDLQTLSRVAQQNAADISALADSVKSLTERLAKTPAPGTPSPQQVYGGNIRTGENPLSSRGFSFLKMLGLLTGDVSPEEAKVELGIHQMLHKHYVQELGTGGYVPGGQGAWGAPRGRFLAPLATDFMHESLVPASARAEMKQLVMAGTSGTTKEEMQWVAQKMLGSAPQNSYWHTKALSWLNELSGGALVAPPEMGELIELLRNKEALVNAGARTVPLPPQGRIKYPRQTTATNTYWVGENAPIRTSQLGTGEVTLQARKLAVLTQAPNELLRFASPAAEALIRDDMTKSLALGLDLAGLEGAGGDFRPRGIINMPGINTLNSKKQGTNGDELVAEDIYRMIAAVEESNAEFTGFIMRPKTLHKYFQLRFDAVAQGDKQGGFLFSLIREASDRMKPTLAGYPVTTSTQVSQVRSKGSSSSLTYVLGGWWEDLLIGMFGAIEFAATTQGDTAFQNDQTWVRGILTADVAARHEAGFVLLDNLDVVNL